MFPIIRHIDDVLPHIEGIDSFIVAKKEGYTVIDYQTICDKGMFDDPYRLECRGIKFDESGNLIARPFHKFFNLGEKETLADIDVTRRHTIMDKLDGSMVHPAIVRGELLPMTRMGHTDVAKQAWEYATKEMRDWCFEVCKNGLTPIFEFTGPTNRIVLPYDRHELTLLAIRDMRDGNYFPDCIVSSCAGDYGFGAVATHTHKLSEEFASSARGSSGIEGFVVRFDNGHMLKIKTEEYVLQHRAKDQIGLEKNALLAVFDGRVDDLISLLPEADGKALRAYEQDVWKAVKPTLLRLYQDISTEKQNYVDRKTFALNVKAKYPQWTHSIFFRSLDGHGEMYKLATETLRGFCSTATTVKHFRERCPGLPVWTNYYSGYQQAEAA